MMPARAKRENPSAASNRLCAVVVLSLPAIVGTAFFLTGVIVSEIFGPGVAPADPFGEPTGIARLKLALGFGLFLACYFGAAYGPLLLPLAGWQAFALKGALGARQRPRFVHGYSSFSASAPRCFWGWLIDLNISSDHTHL